MNTKHCSALLLAAIGLFTTTARAQSTDSAVAQALFDQAKQLMADGRATEACPKLEESERLDPRSGTLINLASCYEETGRLASAWSSYLEAAGAAKSSGHAEREAVARKRAATLAPRLSKLTIIVASAAQSVPGLEVARDGLVVREPQWGVALPSDAGEHEVTASAPGHVPYRTKVSVTTEGATTTVSVPELAVLPESVPKPVPAAASGSEPGANAGAEATPEHGLGAARTAALIAGGIGVVAVGVGTVFGLVSKAKHDAGAPYCNGAPCTDQRGVTDGNAARSDGTISTVAMIIGGVGLATGITLWLTAPKTESTPSARLGVAVSVGSLQLRSSF